MSYQQGPAQTTRDVVPMRGDDFRTPAICEVCRLIDGDNSVKPCKWCEQCQAFICRLDWRNIPRRMLAAMQSRM